MKKRTSKKEIVKTILRTKNLDEKDEEELFEMLIDSPVAIDIDKLEKKDMTFGDKVADKFAAFAGSWTFILGFSLFLFLWIVINLYFLENPVDPYPFILLNLVLSCIAALQAPVIMMSQNRQAKKDSLRNQNDYKIDLKSELILEELHDKMEEILTNQKEIMEKLKKQD